MLAAISRFFRGGKKVKATTDREISLPFPLLAPHSISSPLASPRSPTEAAHAHGRRASDSANGSDSRPDRSRRPSQVNHSRRPSQTSLRRSRLESGVSVAAAPPVPSRAHSNASNYASNSYTATRTRQPRSRVPSQSEQARDRPTPTTNATPGPAIPPTDSGPSRGGVESTATHEAVHPKRGRSSVGGGGSHHSSPAGISQQRPPNPVPGPVAPALVRFPTSPSQVLRQPTTPSPPAPTSTTSSTDSVDAPVSNSSYTTTTTNSLPTQSHSPTSGSKIKPPRLILPTTTNTIQSQPIPTPPIHQSQVDRTPKSAPGSARMSGEGVTDPHPGKVVDEVQEHKARLTTTQGGTLMRNHRPESLVGADTYEDRPLFNKDLASGDQEREPNRVTDWLSHTQSGHPDSSVLPGTSEDVPSVSSSLCTVPSGSMSVGDTQYNNSPEESTLVTQNPSGLQRTIDTQPPRDEFELAQSKPGSLSTQMSPETMFKRLVEHGCPDLTLVVNPERHSKGMVAAGGIGDIHRGELWDGTSVAIKMWRIFGYPTKTVKRTTREIYNWSKMDHDNVHKLLGVIMLDGRIGMVSKWMVNGNLRAYIDNNQELKISRFDLCLQVSRGVQYLHNKGIVHGDLKAANILVSAEGIPKLTDFDHSIILDSTLMFSETTQTGGGTPRWMAPELHADEAPCRNKQTDIYALGMTLLEIITGKDPYWECHSYVQAVLKSRENKHPTRTEHFTQDERGRRMWDLLVKCWDRDRDIRPTADMVLQSLSLLIDETTPLSSSKTE